MSRSQSVLAIMSVLVCHVSVAAAPDVAALEQLSRTGQTLGPEITAQFPLNEQRVANDTGINVLVDLAHQASFDAMWRLPRELRGHGFRSVGSQAALDTVLTPGKLSRVRIPTGKRRPFAWWPNAKFNVVITFQSGPKSQDYLPQEREALARFVESGGGLVIVGGGVVSEDDVKRWTLNALISQFGAALSPVADTVEGRRTPTLALGPEWEVRTKGEAGHPVMAQRQYGKGRVVVFSSSRQFFWNRRAKEGAQDSRAVRSKVIAEAVKWAAAGLPPVGGSRRLPTEAAGGGPIYPELEQRVGSVVVYYAKNQHPELLKTITDDMPAAKRQIEEWQPSRPAEETMYLILSSGGGGGWAVNAYLPKEVGIISLNRLGILSIFAHELAHTMAGPTNAEGEVAGRTPIGNTGEAHAGWFQGKINALYREELRGKSNRDCNRMFRYDKKGDALDLAMAPRELREKWGKGKDWTKTWWVWQKLDDRYGPTWYPRWKWVQHTRWQHEPDRRLTWDEMVEDMSIAVGEDLFPFFRRLGTTLKRDRFSQATFMGQALELPVASIELSPAGPVRLEPIGEYRTPLKVISK